jgi:catechol 2,3-dioxygenase-like lactoylglutathione lyase family enzyme
MLKFVCALIAVENVAVSRHFYEELLGQKVRYDFGVDIQFEGDFTIHQQAHFQNLLGNPLNYPVTQKSNNAELYFETDELDPLYRRLQKAGVEFIHGIQEQPWGQTVMRFYDPDGHIVETGESMETAVLRLHRQGLPVEEIVRKTAMPPEFIDQVLK